MAKIIYPAKKEISYKLKLHFNLIKDPDIGYVFDIDDDNNVILNNEMAEKNFKYVSSHPELYKREVRTEENLYKYPAKALCECGNIIYLSDKYYGASQCKKCGAWHNIFGQLLLDPEEWAYDD